MDAVVIGAGPNGLTAAAALAQHGWRVLVLEAQPRPGGAVWSEELTLPGYLHDVGAAFFPFAEDSPAFRHLDLYDRFGCPGGHIQAAFRCVVRQGPPDRKTNEANIARAHNCWIDPTLQPAAAAAPAGSTGTTTR